jgi:hypothetical protein
MQCVAISKPVLSQYMRHATPIVINGGENGLVCGLWRTEHFHKSQRWHPRILTDHHLPATTILTVLDVRWTPEHSCLTSTTDKNCFKLDTMVTQSDSEEWDTNEPGEDEDSEESEEEDSEDEDLSEEEESEEGESEEESGEEESEEGES